MVSIYYSRLVMGIYLQEEEGFDLRNIVFVILILYCAVKLLHVNKHELN
jgi:hypothetical protein